MYTHLLLLQGLVEYPWILCYGISGVKVAHPAEDSIYEGKINVSTIIALPMRRDRRISSQVRCPCAFPERPRKVAKRCRKEAKTTVQGSCSSANAAPCRSCLRKAVISCTLRTGTLSAEGFNIPLYWSPDL
jgi:hypothetical protein